MADDELIVFSTEHLFPIPQDERAPRDRAAMEAVRTAAGHHRGDGSHVHHDESHFRGGSEEPKNLRVCDSRAAHAEEQAELARKFLVLERAVASEGEDAAYLAELHASALGERRATTILGGDV